MLPFIERREVFGLSHVLASLLFSSSNIIVVSLIPGKYARHNIF